MYSKNHRTVPKACALFCFAVISAWSMDGIAVSYHSTSTNPFGHHAGSIVRHVIKSDTVSQSATIYPDTNARSVCISPTGKHVAFIRTSDGAICTTGINPGSSLKALAEIGATSWIDWAHADKIYFVKYWEHVSVKRLDIATGTIETIGSFPQGIQQMSVSAGRDTLLRGTAILHLGDNRYDVEQFNYKGWQIPDSSFHNYGCGTHISPDGSMFTINACSDDAEYHKTLSVWNWDRSVAYVLSAPGEEYWTRTRWAVNSNKWLVSTIGRGRELLQYHDILLHTTDLSSSIRVTTNSAGAFDEGCDLWVGDPDSVIDTTGIRRHTRGMFTVRGDVLWITVDSSRDVILTVHASGAHNVSVFGVNGESVASYSGSTTSTHVLKRLAAGAYVALLRYSNRLRKSRRFIVE